MVKESRRGARKALKDKWALIMIFIVLVTGSSYYFAFYVWGQKYNTQAEIEVSVYNDDRSIYTGEELYDILSEVVGDVISDDDTIEEINDDLGLTSSDYRIFYGGMYYSNGYSATLYIYSRSSNREFAKESADAYALAIKEELYNLDIGIDYTLYYRDANIPANPVPYEREVIVVTGFIASTILSISVVALFGFLGRNKEHF